MPKRKYKCLETKGLSIDGFEIVPIRDQDKFEIMHWRNNQIDVLRQSEPLNENTQNLYFSTIVTALFEKENPEQLLFSFLNNGTLCGYGGLVHINWKDKNAEISFLMDSDVESNKFQLHWNIYLSLLFKIAFERLNFHKIYTYAFDLRPQLYDILLENGFKEEARLKEHYFHKATFIDVLIHSKINKDVDI